MFSFIKKKKPTTKYLPNCLQKWLYHFLFFHQQWIKVSLAALGAISVLDFHCSRSVVIICFNLQFTNHIWYGTSFPKCIFLYYLPHFVIFPNISISTLILLRVCVCVVLSHSVMSNSLQSFRLYLARLLCPWDILGKILEWVAISSSRGSSQPRAQTHISCISCIAGR